MTNYIDNQDLVERIEKLRKAKGFSSRSQLAIRAGLPKVVMYYIFYHQRRITLDIATRFAKVLECTVEDIIGCPIPEYEFGKKYIPQPRDRRGNLDTAVRKLRDKSLQPREAIKKNVKLKANDTFRQVNFDPARAERREININSKTYMMIDGKKFPVPTEHPPMPQRRPEETFDEYYERLRSGI